MNGKAGITLLALTAMAAAAAPASAGGRNWQGGQRAGEDYARVLSVDPLYASVPVRAPVERCWVETVHDGGYPRGGGSSTGATVLGGLVGAVVGNQFGRGDGRKVGAVAGAVLGSAVAGEMYAQRAGTRQAWAGARDVERCDVVEETRYEQRITAYRVTWEYLGRVQVSELPYDPGEQLRVAVDVRPLR